MSFRASLVTSEKRDYHFVARRSLFTWRDDYDKLGLIELFTISLSYLAQCAQVILDMFRDVLEA